MSNYGYMDRSGVVTAGEIVYVRRSNPQCYLFGTDHTTCLGLY